MSLPDLIRRIQTNPADDAGWTLLITTATDEGQAALVQDVLAARHQQRQDAAAFAFRHSLDLAQDGEEEALRALYEAAGPDGAFRGFFAYGLGLCAAATFSLSGAVPLLREAARHAAVALPQIFAHETAFVPAYLGEVFQQAGLLEAPDWAQDTGSSGTGTGDRAPAEVAPAFPTLPDSDLLLLTACCDRYFTAYAERFLTGAAQALPGVPALIHVINPTPDGDALRARLAGVFPLARFTTETGRADAPFLSCRRLTLAPALRRHAHRDLLVLDVDSVFPAATAAMVAACRGAAVATVSNREALLPTLLVSCAWVFLSVDAPATDRFLSLCTTYLHRKLAEPVVFWTVDQAALFRALCLLPDRATQARDLRDSFPAGIRAFVAADGHIVSTADRQASRRITPVKSVSFGPDLRPLFEPG